MEPGRNFPLRKGTLLTCISWRNAINNPHLNLYFTSPAEAIVSMFREAVVRPFELTIGQPGTVAQNTNPNDDLYLNTFYLTEDIIINPMPDSRLARELAEDPTLNEVRAAIQIDCSSVPDKMGYVVPYQATILYPLAQQRQIVIRPRMTTYIVCRPNILLHAQSFRILQDSIRLAVRELIGDWLEANPNSRISGGVIIDAISKYLKLNTATVLEPVFTQPETPGLATSPVQYDPNLSPIARLPISAEEEFVASPTIETPPSRVEPALRISIPPSSLLSPKDPGIFIPQRSSPGGTTVLDAFASVPNDVVRVIALGMTLDAIAKTCLTSRRFNELICNNEDFWRLRLVQDFGRQFSRDKDDQVYQAAKRKPANWTWKRYYAELSGNVPPAQALDFADQLKDLPDVAEELRRLPRDQYQARVNEMRQQAGLGPVDFGPVMQLAQEGLNDFNEIEADVIRRVPLGRLQPRNLFGIQPLVGPGVMGPVVEENPDVNAEIRAAGALLDGNNNEINDDFIIRQYQRLVRFLNRRPGPRVRHPNELLHAIAQRLARRPGEVMANMLTLELDFERLRQQYPQQWRIADEPIIREAVRNYLAERQARPNRQQAAAMNDRRRYYDEIVRDFAEILVNNAEGRRQIVERLLDRVELPGNPIQVFENLLETIQREYPDLIDGISQDDLINLRNTFAGYQRRNNQLDGRQVYAMGPQPPQPPLPPIDVLNPPQNIVDSYTVLARLAYPAGGPDEYLRQRNELFERIIAQVAGQRGEAAIEFLQAIVDEVLQYPRYREDIGDFAARLMQEFREYVNRPVQDYVPGFDRLLDEFNRQGELDLRLNNANLQLLHDAFGQIYTRARENRQDPVEVLALILQRLSEEENNWDPANNAVITEIFQQRYLPLIGGLVEFITVFREIIDSQEFGIDPETVRRVVNMLQQFVEQNHLWRIRGVDSIFEMLEIFTEVNSLNGQDLWRPDRDPELFNRKMYHQ